MSHNAREGASHHLLTEEDIQRFWLKVNKSDGCWLWVGSRLHLRGGYGEFNVRGKVLRSHRVAYELAHGVKLTRPELVCHRCDNPPCVRSDHLFLGSDADNSKDAYRKGRLYKIPAHKGEASPHARLTEEIVRFVRESREKISGAELARRFGVTKALISKIQLRKAWKHI